MNRCSEPPSSESHKPDNERRRIAIVGYGEGEGREHARRLRDRGHDVSVSVFPGGLSWVHAVHDGFRPVHAWEAVMGADVIVLLVPDDDLELVYFEQVAPHARPGSLILFRGPTTLETERLPPGVDVATVTMSGDGCLLSVQQDATSEARGRSLAYLQWLGGEVPRPTSSRMRVREASDPFPHVMRRVL
jgi:ketol-acid reductoisomerase